MALDYSEIGKRIAQRRKALGLKQAAVCECAGNIDKYLSYIKQAASIPYIQQATVFNSQTAKKTTPIGVVSFW